MTTKKEQNSKRSSCKQEEWLSRFFFFFNYTTALNLWLKFYGVSRLRHLSIRGEGE